MDKEIKIRAILDSSTFDQGIKQIADKLKQITQQQSQGQGATGALNKDKMMGKYAQQAFGDFSKESQQQMQKMYQTQRQEAMQQSISLKGHAAEIAKISKTEGEMTKQQKQRLDYLKQEVDLLKEKHRQTLNTAAETQKALDKLKPPGAPAGAGGGAGGGGGQQPPNQPGNGPMEMFKNYLNKITMAAGAASIYNGAMNMATDYIGREGAIVKNNGAMANVMSREAREQMAGRGARGQYWMPERMRSMRGAAKQSDRERMMDFLPDSAGSAITGLAAGYAGMVAGGTAGVYAGGAIGTAFGGIGALPGAVIGGAVGAIGGAAAGIYGSMGEKGRARYFDQEKYRSMKGKELADDYAQRLAAEKALNYKKDMSYDYIEQNSDQISGLSRSLGLSNDKQLFGERGIGNLQTNMAYGGQYGGANFSQSTIQDQVQALASGGAMTSGMRDLSGAAATYNRQFNLSNAGQTMGKMQGNTGMNSSQTDMAYQRLMAEAVRQGVDTSTMPKEMERMTQITAELVTSGGGNATGMTGLFGAGLSGFDQKSMGSAVGAAGAYEGAAKESAGWQGQMGMGFLQSSKGKEFFGNLGAKDMNMINQLSIADMPEEEQQRYADYLGISKEQFVAGMQAKDQTKQNLTSGGDKEAKELGDFYKANNATTGEQRKALTASGEGAKLFTAFESTRYQQGDMTGKDASQRRADIDLQANMAAGNTPAMSLDVASQAVQDQKKKGVDKVTDVMEGAQATGDITKMNTLSEHQKDENGKDLGTYLDQMKKAAQAHTQTAELYDQQMKRFVEAAKTGADSMEKVVKSLEDLSGTSGLHSGGTPSGGH